MEFSTIVRTVAILACPVGMGLMMWWMMKGMSGNQSQPTMNNQVPADRATALRAQRTLLEAEIAKTERLMEIESQREAKSTSPMADEAEAPAS